MKSDPLFCDRELLRQSLDDALSEQQEEDLASHLSECEACRAELERLAADRDDWSRVSDVLKHEARARSRATGAGSEGLPAPEPPAGESRLVPLDGPAVLAADFAVDFLEPAASPGTLGRLGDIDIHEVIGCGGMGIVLRGIQRELNRPVAVKVLAPHLATSGAARRRFAREAQAAAVIVHPHVMPILTVHSSGKLPHLVMPYVACESLQQRLDRDGSLAMVDVLRIAMQIASGLAAAHAQGLVHRDIKPANVLLEKGVNRAMLTDFGLARAADDASLTRTGVIAGTPQYMSPEQARGESVDARSDLFSLGSVMYSMSAGRPPFRAETSYGILRRITDTEPRPLRELNPDIPDWLAAIIEKLHAKNPADRFPSADALARLLEQCLAHVQQPTAVPLPKAAQELAASIAPASVDDSDLPASAGSASMNWSRPQILATGAILAGAAAIGLLVAIPFWHSSHNMRTGTRNESREADAPTDRSTSVPVAGTESAFARWDDGVEGEILELDQDVELMEHQAGQLWQRKIGQEEQGANDAVTEKRP